MNSEKLKVKSKKKILIIFIFCCLSAVYCLLPFVSQAETVDRIAATVNDEVITLSEIREKAIAENRDERAVLDGMINRVLLLSEAKRLGIAGIEENENIIINNFIERRIKAFVLISMEKSREFYEKHKEEFKDKDFSEVRDEINLYLVEEETNKRLKEFLAEARKKADIRILY